MIRLLSSARPSRWWVTAGAVPFLALGVGLMSTALAQDEAEEPAFGFGNVGVNKTRVVFEGRKRSDEIILWNRGSLRTVYRIFFRNMRMTEVGSFQEIKEPDPGQRFANKIIRYSPRQVTVAAGASQSVRLLARKPRDLADGEYRSHLVIQAIPPPNVGESIEPGDVEESQFVVQMVPVVGISMPIIVRHGNLSAAIALSNLTLEPTSNPQEPLLLRFRFERTGERSVYGNVIVTFKPESGSEVEVGVIRGISVLTPNAIRKVRLGLRPPEGVTLARGRLHVLFRESDDQPGAVVAEADISIP